MTDVLRVLAPRPPLSAVVASIPHSGTFVPADIAAQFTDEHRAWLRNTDWFLDELYDFLPELGVLTVAATHSRYVADVNRDPQGLAHGSFFKDVVAATTADGRAVYRAPIAPEPLQDRVERYHRPYHLCLQRALDQAAALHGRALLLDLHSYMSPGEADVCLGDAHGSTAHIHTRQLFEDAFRSNGFSVSANDPWSGGHIVRHHAAPPRIEAMQIELRYTTYLDESTVDVPGEPLRHPTNLNETRGRLHQSLTTAIQRWEQAKGRR